jgi:hypothetical protein
MTKDEAREYLRPHYNRWIHQIYHRMPDAFFTLYPGFEYPNWDRQTVGTFLNRCNRETREKATTWSYRAELSRDGLPREMIEEEFSAKDRNDAVGKAYRRAVTAMRPVLGDGVVVMAVWPGRLEGPARNTCQTPTARTPCPSPSPTTRPR